VGYVRTARQVLPDSWLEELDEFRAAKDEFFRSHHDSPLPSEVKKAFSGLKYFPPDPAYKFRALLHRYERPEALKLATSKGTEQDFVRVGYFELSIAGKQVRVHAYKSTEREDPELFIPFRDATSGRESYGAARYLDVEDNPTNEFVLDFNYSYNPYCAYSEDYVCPLPPKENWLDVEIRAGEMKYK
jgi:uncharacterized protein (DUF1684 family)